MKRFSIMIFLTCFCLGLASMAMAEHIEIELYSFKNEADCLAFYNTASGKLAFEGFYRQEPVKKYSHYSYFATGEIETSKNKIIPFTFRSFQPNLIRQGIGFLFAVNESDYPGFFGEIVINKEKDTYWVKVSFNETKFHQNEIHRSFTSNAAWQLEAPGIYADIDRNMLAQPVIRSLSFDTKCLNARKHIYNVSNYEQKTYQVLTLQIK